MTEIPQSVEVVLESREIPDERIESWKDDWGDLGAERLDYDNDLEQYLEARAKEWVEQKFLSAQGHCDAHLWVDEYEVQF